MFRGARMAFVYAHPDDESFITGGTAAHYSSQGVEVYLLCATRGEAGRTGIPPVCAREELPRVRTEEVIRAAVTLGISEVQFLDYRDGTLSEQPTGEMAGEIAEALLAWRPHVVVTFPPDGLSGHPDHRAVHRAARRAVALCGERGWTVPRLFYAVFPASFWRTVGRDRPGVEESSINVTLELGEAARVKLEAVRKHRTQNHVLRWYLNFPEEEILRLYQREYFLLDRELSADSDVSPTCLFAGLLDS